MLELLTSWASSKPHILGGSAGGYTGAAAGDPSSRAREEPDPLQLHAGFKGDQGKRWLRESAVRGMRPVFEETIDERIPVAEADPRLIEWVLGEICKNDLKFLERFIGHWTDTGSWTTSRGSSARR